MPERQHTHEPFERRLKGRLSAGLLLGVLVGGILGVVVGALAFDGRAPAIVACGLGGVIAGLLYGTLVGSFAALESPDRDANPPTRHTRFPSLRSMRRTRPTSPNAARGPARRREPLACATPSGSLQPQSSSSPFQIDGTANQENPRRARAIRATGRAAANP